MNRTTLTSIAFALPIASLVLAGSTQVASAGTPHPGKGAQASVATGPQPASAKMPQLLPSAAFKGYTVVTSALLNDAASSQVLGTVSCAAGMKVVGGGAVISSSQLTENLNTSRPSTDGTGWQAYVNNASSTAGTFRVYAVCVAKVAKYAVVVGANVANAAGVQSTATVGCPGKTVPLGGGGFASSGATSVNLNTSIPSTTGWRVDVNNASTTADTVSAYVVCGAKPKGYVQTGGASTTTIAADTQGSASVACPGATMPLGGGSFSNSGSTLVDLNSEAPNGATWIAYQNSVSSGSSLTAYVVCATVS